MIKQYPFSGTYTCTSCQKRHKVLVVMDWDLSSRDLTDSEIAEKGMDLIAKQHEALIAEGWQMRESGLRCERCSISGVN
jgi:hypothetical protein